MQHFTCQQPHHFLTTLQLYLYICVYLYVKESNKDWEELTVPSLEDPNDMEDFQVFVDDLIGLKQVVQLYSINKQRIHSITLLLFAFTISTVFCQKHYNSILLNV